MFADGAVVSPPRDWDRWSDLIRDLVTHWTERYGLAEVRDHWSFEVWNEPNLDVFWSGTREEYFRLYDVTASAVRSVNPDLRIGGPASAASEWVDELLAHLAASGSPLDFVKVSHGQQAEPAVEQLAWRAQLRARARGRDRRRRRLGPGGGARRPGRRRPDHPAGVERPAGPARPPTGTRGWTGTYGCGCRCRAAGPTG